MGVQIISNPVKLARRRREAPESSRLTSFGPPDATEKAGQHSLPGGSQAEDQLGKSERRDSVEWSEERAFQTVDRRFVKCRGRRFSRDLLDLPLYTYIMERKGSGKCERVEGYAFVINDFRESQGRASDCPQKMSEGERAERCASERV